MIPRDYTSMAENTIFVALGIQDKYLEKATLIRSNFPPGSYKTSHDTSPPQISFSLHCKQINKVKNELDGQPSSLLSRMHVSNCKAAFSPVHLVFLELGIHQPHLDFKIIYEKNNGVILRTFYLQLLNKEWLYTTMKLKFIQIKTLQHHKNHNHIVGRNCLKLRHIFLMKLKFVNKMPKKKEKEMIQYNHRYRRHNPHYINSDHRSNKHCSICQFCCSARWYCFKWN